jgi:alpha-amylase
MYIGKQHSGSIFTDITGNRQEETVINENGEGDFHCNAGSVSVWIKR